MRASPVDVLIIDEAGQLALADALAASRAAHNLMLLGDPLQLPQVSQATHPGRSRRSVLEHMLGDHVHRADRRGVFLTETRRMHPDVCTFISDEIYEGRLRPLTSRAPCRRTASAPACGGCTPTTRVARPSRRRKPSSSRDEIAALIGIEVDRPTGTQQTLSTAATSWWSRPTTTRSTCCADRSTMTRVTCAVKVGTVDKFQGQQAPVVFFTMTTSTAEDMPRGPDFLFSRNRLNVAISRAKCLAYVVCTDELLEQPSEAVEEMRFISTLCAAVDYADATREDDHCHQPGD